MTALLEQRDPVSLLADALGVGVRVVDAGAGAVDADVVVVDAPRRWSLLWRWRTRCGRALGVAAVPVLVAARQPRPLRTCLVAVAPPFDVERIPPWVRCFAHVEGVVAVDPSAYILLAGMPFPSAFVTNDAGSTKPGGPLVAACRRRLGTPAVSQHVGSLMSAIGALYRSVPVDVVFLPDSLCLPYVVDELGAAAIVPPLEHRAAPLRYSWSALP